jgi:hypothetical protein
LEEEFGRTKNEVEEYDQARRLNVHNKVQRLKRKRRFSFYSGWNDIVTEAMYTKENIMLAI